MLILGLQAGNLWVGGGSHLYEQACQVITTQLQFGVLSSGPLPSVTDLPYPSVVVN